MYSVHEPFPADTGGGKHVIDKEGVAGMGRLIYLSSATDGGEVLLDRTFQSVFLSNAIEAVSEETVSDGLAVVNPLDPDRTVAATALRTWVTAIEMDLAHCEYAIADIFRHEAGGPVVSDVGYFLCEERGWMVESHITHLRVVPIAGAEVRARQGATPRPAIAIPLDAGSTVGWPGPDEFMVMSANSFNIFFRDTDLRATETPIAEYFRPVLTAMADLCRRSPDAIQIAAI